MKKLLAIVSVCAVGTAVFAQGTIQWAAPGSAFIGRTNSAAYSGFEASSGTPSAGGSGVTTGGGTSLYYYALLTSSGLSTGPTSLSQFTGTLANSWMDTGLMLTNSTANGRTSPVGGAQNAAPAANWASGSTQNAVIVGWSANLGSTWTAALANLNNWSTVGSGILGSAYFGVSTVGTGLTPSLANPGIVVIGPSAGLIDGSVATGTPLTMNLLYVAPVPEPGTIALACLGGASLLLFRRKK